MNGLLESYMHLIHIKYNLLIVEVETLSNYKLAKHTTKST